MKLNYRTCNNCRHHSSGDWDSWCSHPKALVIGGNNVIGYRMSEVSCEAARSPKDGVCGFKGKLWEPSLWFRIWHRGRLNEQ